MSVRLSLSWLPNALTSARIAAAPLAAFAYARAFDVAAANPMAARAASEFWIMAALALFGLAALLDWADGFAARRLNARSILGQRLDPAADKILAAAGFVVLLVHGSNGVYGADLIAPVFAILARDALVAAARAGAAADGAEIAPSRLAKFKTALELAALALLIAAPLGPLVGWGGGLAHAGWLGLWAAAALSWVSGWPYVRQGFFGRSR